MAEFTSEELGKLTEKLLNERGLDFRDYKPTSLGRRIQRRLDATKSPDIEAYLKLLERRPDEYSKLIDSILINVTQFFRDPEAWDIIRKEVIPRILSEKRPGDQIRLWSAGCATGEEAYSLAIAISEALGRRMGEFDVRIYATDIDDDALAIARRAEYSDDAVASLPTDLLEKYFVRNGQWSVKRDLRKLLIFDRHNLANDAPISHVDLVACRNVLIYMSVDLQNRILNKFHYGLEANGYLFLGKAESLLAASRVFSPVSERWRIFRKESGMRGAGRPTPEQQRLGMAVDAGGTEFQQGLVFVESVLRHTPTGILAVDDDNTIKLINPAAESIWGIRAADVLDRQIMQVAESPALQEMLPKISQARTSRSEVR